jgi:pimeloyl-ACP methyl ester carboxylesterase
VKHMLAHIRLPGRAQLEYVVQGSRCDTPVIALHGVTDSWRSFEPVLTHLPPGLHTIALSQRGHGNSDKPADGYSPTDFAADVAAFMDAMQIGRAVLVGNSMGSINAMRFALDRHDAFCSAADQQAMLRSIPTAWLIEYSDAGHAMHWEEPQRFALDLSRFATVIATCRAVA